MTSLVSISHTFETAHRLPFLPGKCESLHGHSWAVEVGVQGTLDLDGILVNFTPLKAHLRNWIDAYLDHGTMLGGDDPLVDLRSKLGKVASFDASASDSSGMPDSYLGSVANGLYWPTVENVAVLIGRVMTGALVEITPATDVFIAQVIVSETSTNKAVWGPGL